MLDWLKQQRQPRSAIDRFWRTVLVSALNEELDRIDAAHGIAVFWKAFLSNPAGFRVGVPTVPLDELYESARIHIHDKQGDVCTRLGVSEVHFEGNRVSGVRLTDGSHAVADYYIAAVPFDRLLKLLPERMRSEGPFAKFSNFHVSPITSVHMWFDRTVMQEAFIASLDQTIQWVFNRTGRYVQIVIRISPEPGSDDWRPSQRTDIENFFIAGDWTQTGWPATMESAVRSGYQAAETIMSLNGVTGGVVQSDLPVGRLVRWLSA
jgi:hypothetical protein